tara:strand:- start:464 stop:643 length:180 start_codon:yes stop_codon:yes gene_type:complete
MKLSLVNRFEVINHTDIDDSWIINWPTGRVYVKYLEPDEQITYQVQDEGRTLKMFIGKK